MNSLPVELVQIIANKLPILSYINLRATCKIFQKLKKEPRLEFEAYKESVLEREEKGSGVKLSINFQLDFNDFNIEQYIFLAKTGCVKEFDEANRQRKVQVTSKMKERAFKTIMESDLNSDMIVELVFASIKK